MPAMGGEWRSSRIDSPQHVLTHTIDKANSKFDLKFKETLNINWREPNLNAQQNHLALTF